MTTTRKRFKERLLTMRPSQWLTLKVRHFYSPKSHIQCWKLYHCSHPISLKILCKVILHFHILLYWRIEKPCHQDYAIRSRRTYSFPASGEPAHCPTGGSEQLQLKPIRPYHASKWDQPHPVKLRLAQHRLGLVMNIPALGHVRPQAVANPAIQGRKQTNISAFQMIVPPAPQLRVELLDHLFNRPICLCTPGYLTHLAVKCPDR